MPVALMAEMWVDEMVEKMAEKMAEKTAASSGGLKAALLVIERAA